MNSIWLKDFTALVEAQGFSKAAEQRCVTQPSLSRRIQALEDWVGVTLVDRSTHTFRLTPAGETFLPLARDLLRQLNHCRLQTQEAGENSEQILRFAATHVLSLTFFPHWLRMLEADKPLTATVELTADHMVACENLMLEGRAQFLICHHHVAAPIGLQNDFRSLVIGQDALVPVATPSLLAKHALADLPRLAFTNESGMGRILASAQIRAGLAGARPAVFSSHLSSVLTAMARNGRGVAWSPRTQIEDDLASGMLTQVQEFGEPIEIEIRLWRHKTRQSSVAEALWRQVKTAL